MAVDNYRYCPQNCSPRAKMRPEKRLPPIRHQIGCKHYFRTQTRRRGRVFTQPPPFAKVTTESTWSALSRRLAWCMGLTEAATQTRRSAKP